MSRMPHNPPGNPWKTPITKIETGPGLTAKINHHGHVLLDMVSVPSITPIPPKPIFMIGLPSSMSPEIIEKNRESLHEHLPDYHVLVLKNITDTYTAKLFSVDDDDTLPITDIKKYINQKLKNLKNGKRTQNSN